MTRKPPKAKPRRTAANGPTLGSAESRELRRLSAVARLLDALEEEALAEAVVREAVALCRADYALLFLARTGERQLALRGSTLPPEHAVRRALASAAESSAPGPLDRREAGPFSRQEIGALFSGAHGSPGVRGLSLASIPMSREMFHGLLVIGQETGSGELGKPVIQEAIAFAQAITPQLRTVQLLARYRDLMIRDDQTRSFNRRYFDSSLEEEFIRASRYRSSLSLIFIDLDNLKQINERHGHAMGSEAIRQTADRLLPLIRAVDKLFRYGGDEFCVVLPETSWEGALEVAERLRHSMEEAPFLEEATGGISLTASFGVASYPDHASTQEELVRAADDAMYQGKQTGKNVILVAEPGFAEARRRR